MSDLARYMHFWIDKGELRFEYRQYPAEKQARAGASTGWYPLPFGYATRAEAIDAWERQEIAKIQEHAALLKDAHLVDDTSRGPR
jgi:hypothetical protein